MFFYGTNLQTLLLMPLWGLLFAVFLVVFRVMSEAVDKKHSEEQGGWLSVAFYIKSYSQVTVSLALRLQWNQKK